MFTDKEKVSSSPKNFTATPGLFCAAVFHTDMIQRSQIKIQVMKENNNNKKMNNTFPIYVDA